MGKMGFKQRVSMMGLKQRASLYCSGCGGGGTEAKGQNGLGLTINKSILQDVEKDGLAEEYTGARVMKCD